MPLLLPSVCTPPPAPRTELPESLKALFRPVSMVLPDLGLICEIMLMAEGFQSSKLLSRKFVILYKLCEVRGVCYHRWTVSASVMSDMPPLLSVRTRCAAPPGPSVQEQALRLEAARYQDHALRCRRHEARCP